MIAGETNATRQSELGSARLKCSQSDLAAALDGRVTAHHQFLIDHHLGLIKELERRIAAFDARIEEVLAPFRDTVERKCQAQQAACLYVILSSAVSNIFPPMGAGRHEAQRWR